MRRQSRRCQRCPKAPLPSKLPSPLIPCPDHPHRSCAAPSAHSGLSQEPGAKGLFIQILVPLIAILLLDPGVVDLRSLDHPLVIYISRTDQRLIVSITGGNKTLIVIGLAAGGHVRGVDPQLLVHVGARWVVGFRRIERPQRSVGCRPWRKFWALAVRP